MISGGVTVLVLLSGGAVPRSPTRADRTPTSARGCGYGSSSSVRSRSRGRWGMGATAITTTMATAAMGEGCGEGCIYEVSYPIVTHDSSRLQ